MDGPFTLAEAADVDADPASCGRCYELTSTHLGMAFCDDWPISPGAVRRTSAGRSSILHFAPGRWLVPEPDDELFAECEAYATSGAAYLFDVEGKWRMVSIPAGTARAVLSRDCFAESVLDGRGCAATVLFDCPVIIADCSKAFEIWVQSSYLSALLRAIRLVREKLAGQDK